MNKKKSKRNRKDKDRERLEEKRTCGGNSRKETRSGSACVGAGRVVGAVDVGLWACLLQLASVSVYRVCYMLLRVCDMLEGKDTTWSQTSDKSSTTFWPLTYSRSVSLSLFFFFFQFFFIAFTTSECEKHCDIWNYLPTGRKCPVLNQHG